MAGKSEICDITEILSQFCVVLANQSRVQYYLQKLPMSVDEAFSPSGAFTVFLALAMKIGDSRAAQKLRVGFYPDKSALFNCLPVVPVTANDPSQESRWKDRLRKVLNHMEERAAPNYGIVHVDDDYATFYSEAQVGQAQADHYVWKTTKDELMEYFMTRRVGHDETSNIFDADTEAQSKSSSASVAKHRESFVPQVSRAEIAEFLVAPIIDEIEALRARQVKPFCLLVQHPYGDFEGDLARALSTRLKCDADLIVSSAEVSPKKGTNGNSDASVVKPDALIDRLNGGGNVHIFASAPEKLPTEIRELVNLDRSIKRFTATSLAKALEALYAPFSCPPIPEGAWIRLVKPKDFLVNAQRDEKLIDDIRQSVERRLALVGAENALSLDELDGMPEAKAWAVQLISDLRLAEMGPQAGGISWDDVDKGALFEGPPGVGKTSIARAIAKACGLRFINASAASWQAAGALDDHLRAMDESFVMAIEYAPSILFIDEIDSIGSRETLSGDGAQYQTEVINALLQQLDGFKARDRIVVLAATNHVQRVDPALKRPGRLDRVIRIPYPNASGLKGIYRHYLKGIDHCLSDSDIEQVARMSLGLTGADVELYVRDAKRKARVNGKQKMDLQELLEQIYRTPPENQRRPMSDDELHNTAVHEAGHAMAIVLGPDKGKNINFISIVPRSDGSLGFVSNSSPGSKTTREECLHQLRVTLAGHAAEVLYFGQDQASGGAGGQDPRCDLAQATSFAEYLLTKQGWGSSSGLLWRKAGVDADPELRTMADKMLAEQHAAVRELLSQNKAKMDELVDLLKQRQEITGEELRRRFSQ